MTVRDRLKVWWQAWRQPVPASTYVALRIGLGLAAFAELFRFAPEMDWLSPSGPGRLETLSGIFPHDASRISLFFYLPEQLVFFLGFFAALGYTLGLFTPVSGPILWLVTVSLRNRLAWAWMDGGLQVLPGALLIMLFAPTGGQLTLGRFRSSRHEPATYADSWPLRLLQLQLCLIYLQSGYYKLLGAQWTQGDAVGLMLMSPYYSTFASGPWLETNFAVWMGRLATWGTLIWELLFPLGILWRRSRWLFLLAGVGFHLGLAVFVKLGHFPWNMLVLYLAFMTTGQPPGPPRPALPAGVRWTRLRQIPACLLALFYILMSCPDKALLEADSPLATRLPGLFFLDRQLVCLGQGLAALPGSSGVLQLARRLGLDHKFTTFAPVVADFVVNYQIVDVAPDGTPTLLWNGLPQLSDGRYRGFAWQTRMVSVLADRQSEPKVYLLLDGFKKLLPPGHAVELREYWIRTPVKGSYFKGLLPGRQWRLSWSESGQENFDMLLVGFHRRPL